MVLGEDFSNIGSRPSGGSPSSCIRIASDRIWSARLRGASELKVTSK